jgi:hypothetical protein
MIKRAKTGWTHYLYFNSVLIIEWTTERRRRKKKECRSVCCVAQGTMVSKTLGNAEMLIEL